MQNISKKTILLVEDSATLAKIYEEFLRQEDYAVTAVDTGQKGIDYLNNSQPLAIVLDLHLPDIHGLEILTHAKKIYPDLPVIVVTANNSVDVAVDAMRRGAYDFIVKPFPAPRLVVTIRNALEHKNLTTEVGKWRQAVGQDKFHNFIGQSPVMQGIYRIIDAAAANRAAVFLKGENGTGKELAAHAIHMASPRRNKPFIPINCAAIPRELMESTIFGHMKGAFTGAIADQPGAAKEANGGTLFLDEICEMPMDLQTKLLRFVQSGEIQPVGSSKGEITDVRIIVATNRDPIEEVNARRFREDLFYRLHVIPIEMPALREREEDVLMLASHFLSRFSAEENKKFTSLSPEVMSLFRRHDWPGNVRQLENVIRNVVVLHNGNVVTESMLPKDLKRFVEESKVPAANQNTYDLFLTNIVSTGPVQPLWQTEKDSIMNALGYTNQDIVEAAALLEVSPSTLYRKIQLWRGPNANPEITAVSA